MNYFYTKLDINLCQTRLRSKVVIKCAILDKYDLGFFNPFFCDMYIMYIAEFKRLWEMYALLFMTILTETSRELNFRSTVQNSDFNILTWL